MNDDYEDVAKYSFSYTDCNGKVYTKEITTQDVTWTECLNDFVRFLESVYEYDIMSKVRIQESKMLNSIYKFFPEYVDPWTGEYFTDDADDKASKTETHFSWEE